MRKISSLGILIGIVAAVSVYFTAGSQLVWQQTSYDFGLIKEIAGPRKGEVKAVNLGKEPVSITGARPSCGCTSVDYPKDPIAPGDTAVFSFVYDPSGRPGRFEKSIRVYVGDNDAYRIRIRGNVLGTPESLSRMYPAGNPPLRLSDGVVNAGDVLFGEVKNFFVNGYNESPDSVTLSLIDMPENPRMSVSSIRLGPGDIVTFGLYFNSHETPEMGPVSIPIKVGVDSGEAQTVSEMEFRANVLPDISKYTPEQVENGPRCAVMPPTVDLGIVRDGKVPFKIGVMNEGKTKMKLMRVFGKSDRMKIDSYPDVLKPGKSCIVEGTIDVTGIDAGAFHFYVEVITDDPLHPVRRVGVVGIMEGAGEKESE